jgi:hypothetical protein
MTVRDSKNFTAVCDDVQEPSEAEKAAARLTVCGNAFDAADAADLLSMLGLSPGGDFTPPVTTLRRSFS